MAAHAERPPRQAVSRQRRQSAPRLDPDTAEYFRRALETLRDGLSEEELALFTPNVLSEACHALPALSLHPAGSQLLVQLLPHCPADQLTTLLPLLLPGGLGGPAGHPWGSRVLQAALLRVLGALGEGRGAGQGLGGALGRVGEVLLGEGLGEVARDPNGSFVLRALLGVLGGRAVTVSPLEGAEPRQKGAEPKQKGAGLKQEGAWSLPEGAELPASFRPLLEKLAEALEEELPALLSPPCASLALQELLFALRRSQSASCSRLCRALIGCLSQASPAHDQSPLLTSLQDPAHSRLLEAAMTVMEPDELRKLFQGHFRGHLRGVASHRVANHGLQRLLDHAPEDVVGAVLSELGPALSEPLANGQPGVVIALLRAARRCPALQQEVVRWLFQALRCWDPPGHAHCVTALLQLRPLEGVASGEGAEPEPLPSPTLWGSLALQNLLHFGEVSPVLPNFLSFSPKSLLSLALTPPGSRIWDEILGSPSVPSPTRRRLLRKLQGQWSVLATHRSGSRVLDKIWDFSSFSMRVKIAKELAPQLPALQQDPHGRGISRNLGLEFFLRDSGGWARMQRGEGKRGRGLAAILEL